MARAGASNAILAHDGAVPAELVADHIPPDSGVALREVSSVLFPATDALRASDADVPLIGPRGRLRRCAQPDLSGGPDRVRGGRSWCCARRARAASNGFVEEVSSAGADDPPVLDDSPEVLRRIARHLVFSLDEDGGSEVMPIETVEASGKVIRALGPKGGIGKTITSCNLGAGAGDAEQARRARRPGPAVRRRRALARADARHDRVRSGRAGRRASTREARRVPDASPVRLACPGGTGKA